MSAVIARFYLQLVHKCPCLHFSSPPSPSISFFFSFSFFFLFFPACEQTNGAVRYSLCRFYIFVFLVSIDQLNLTSLTSFKSFICGVLQAVSRSSVVYSDTACCPGHDYYPLSSRYSDGPPPFVDPSHPSAYHARI